MTNTANDSLFKKKRRKCKLSLLLTSRFTQLLYSFETYFYLIFYLYNIERLLEKLLHSLISKKGDVSFRNQIIKKLGKTFSILVQEN